MKSMRVIKVVLSVLLLSTIVSANDIIVKKSRYSVVDTMKNIETIVKSKGMTVFAVINHQGNAVRIGGSLNPSKEIIFGNPKVGTALMKQNMLIGLDLPMRILVFKDKDNTVKIAYRDGTWIKKTHGLTSSNLSNKVNNALNQITNRAAGK